MPILTDGPRLEPEGGGISELSTSLGDVAGASASQALADLPIQRAKDIRELGDALGERESEFDLMDNETRADYERAFQQVVPGYRSGVEIRDVPIAEANARIKAEGFEKALTLPEASSIRETALDIMLDRARARRERETTLMRGPDGMAATALTFGTSLLVGAIDPLNLAAFSIPVLGELRYAKILAEAGESAIARAGVRAATGATAGAAGAAAMVPMFWRAATQEGRDYTAAEALHDVMINAVLGGVFHSVGGGVADVVRRSRGEPVYPFAPGEPFDRSAGPGVARDIGAPERAEDGRGKSPAVPAERSTGESSLADGTLPTPAAAALANLPPRSKEDLMRASVASLIEGEPVRVGEMLQVAAAIDPRIASVLREADFDTSQEFWHGTTHGAFTKFAMSKAKDDTLGPAVYLSRNRGGAEFYGEGRGGVTLGPFYVRGNIVEPTTKVPFHFNADGTVKNEAPAQVVMGWLRQQLITGRREAWGEGLSPAEYTREFWKRRGVDGYKEVGGLEVAVYDPDNIRAGFELPPADRGTRLADAWRDLSNHTGGVDDPDAIAASKAAEALPEPASTQPDKRLAAAEAAAADAEQIYAAAEPFLPDDLRQRVAEDVTRLDQDAAMIADVIKRGGACLTAAVG